MKIKPNHVVGDFDSVSKEILLFYQKDKQIIFYPYHPEKDNTDTDIALTLAIQLKSSNITIIGALGGRMDHALANIHILKKALRANIPCQILDHDNKIYLLDKETKLSKSKLYGQYISLIPLTTTVEGVTLTGFKYPLTHACMSIGESLGVSNEMIHDVATISLTSGIFIVIESRDCV